MYNMWKKGRNEDYKFIDDAIADQYLMGGVDMWIYAYQGPTGNNGSTDSTKPDYTTNQSTLTSLSDYVFGEVVERSYNLQAITIPAVYQVQEAQPDMKSNAFFFNYDTMDITVHYNMMMQRIGRKLIPGDVIELPNLRDFDVLNSDVGLNKFYVVQDAFRTSEGYSATWQHHIFKIRVKPLTDSPEFSSILDNNQFPDNPDDPNNGNGNSSSPSTFNNEMNIMNLIVAQADSEVPYIHWDNEHIYDDITNSEGMSSTILSGYQFPVTPSKNMFFYKLTYPTLYELNSSNVWELVDVQYGTSFPKNPEDLDFFFLENDSDITGYSLYQYSKSVSRWVSCVLPYTDSDTVPAEADDFYCSFRPKQLYQVQDDGVTWVIPDVSYSDVPFTTKEIASNRTLGQDTRAAIPPARGDVEEGSTFPENPTDKQYFYRTDYTPVTLWQYSAQTSTWSQFNYGGRLPWTGANIEQTNYINSPDRVSIQDVVKPNIAYKK